MTYADKLLADGETVVLRTRQHPIAFIKDAWKGLGLWLVAVLLLIAVVFFNVTDVNYRNLITLAALFVFVVGLIIIVWQYMLWRTEEYMVTNRRLMKVSGVVNKRSADSSLEKINDAILSQGFWGRVLNYGDLDILTAAEAQVDSYRMLNAAPTFKKTMLNEKHNLEVELSGGHVITAPLRATEPPMPRETAPEMTRTETVTTAPPPMSPPPPPPAPVDPALDITQTLARLADLRDRGAITPAEYASKKAELLGRL
jgi:predicted negative regulator of RcsB-dependent stress response